MSEERPIPDNQRGRPGPGSAGSREPEEPESPVVHDRRRVDPETGQLREQPDPGAGAHRAEVPAEGQPSEREATEGGATGGELEELRQALGERTADLQRTQAEYVNYKRRVDRDREAVREQAVGNVLTELLPILDDIGRAREHGELDGGFKAVAESFEAVVTKLGLVRYGEVGDDFDPRIHEALMHAYSDDVRGPTCSAVLQPGYRHGERVLRPARVAVAEPTAGLPDQEVPGEEVPDQAGADQAGADQAGKGAPPGDETPPDEDIPEQR